jgi:glycosyltransferase involved in cell wall biosynthesis
MRNILFIIPSLIGGGAERVLINLLHLLKEQEGFQITLCSAVRKGVYVNAVPSGIEVKYLYKNAFVGKVVEKCVRDFGMHFIMKIRVKRVLKGHFNVGISFLDSIFSEILFYPGPVIDKRMVVIHSSYLTYKNKSRFIQGDYKRKLLGRYARLDTIISVSNDVEKEFVEAFGPFRDMRVIYNPINVDQIRERAKEPVEGNLNDRIQLLAIGSLIPVKNHMRLLRAVELLARDGIDFHLRILGKGTLQQTLQEFIDDRMLNDYVELAGFVENPYPFLKSADIFVISSVAEGLPTVIGEAMVLGVPVVSTNCPGSREILDHGKYGILTEQDDHALYEGIKKLFNEKERAYFRSKSVERATVFNDQHALDEYVSLLEN